MSAPPLLLPRLLAAASAATAPRAGAPSPRPPRSACRSSAEATSRGSSRKERMVSRICEEGVRRTETDKKRLRLSFFLFLDRVAILPSSVGFETSNPGAPVPSTFDRVSLQGDHEHHIASSERQAKGEAEASKSRFETGGGGQLSKIRFSLTRQGFFFLPLIQLYFRTSI